MKWEQATVIYKVLVINIYMFSKREFLEFRHFVLGIHLGV